MKTLRNLLLLVLIAAVFVPSVYAQERMTYEEYLLELERWRQREEVAVGDIATLEEEIEALRQQLAALDDEIEAEWDAIYATAGTDDDPLMRYNRQMDEIAAEIANLNRVPASQLRDRMDEIDELERQIAELKNSPEALLSEQLARLQELEAQLRALKGRIPAPKNLTYEVVYGDFLWKIAGKKNHYNDPWKWMRIYSANLDQIKDPDLIFPKQRLTIPMDIDRRSQYLVGQGDFLYQIADNLYGDPFRWRKLYEANDQLIEDPNMIYPEMILSVPGQ